jgi:DmsE family decaheme c-type cytochrome
LPALLGLLAGGLLLVALTGPPVGAAPAEVPKVEGATYVGADICKGCHEDQFKKLDRTLHSRTLGQNARTPLQGHICESCHGPGSKHIEDQANPANIIRFSKTSVQSTAQRDAVCLQCHQRGKRMFWQGSAHQGVNSCTTCHSIKTPQSASGQLKAKDQMSLCRTCHAAVVAQQANWSHMPVREGKLQCSSCHNVHGTVTEKLIVDNSVNENCYRCHLDKRGPFLWEHAPVRENCLNCHDAHGSNNDKDLASKRPFLCQRCHIGTRHPSTMYDLPDLTGSANNRSLNRSCTNCHSQIHGSNHPSGRVLTR